MSFSALLERCASLLCLIGDRTRASVARIRGARLGKGTRIGRRVVISGAGCLEAGRNVLVEHDVYIKAIRDDTVIRIGREVFIGFHSELDVTHQLWIGDHVLIAPGCFITDHGHRHAAGSLIADQGCDHGPVRIEDDVWLGAKVVVLPGITIGRGAVVAAGAVVTRDVEPMSIVAGVPARKIGARS